MPDYRCDRVKKINTAQIKLIRKHLDQHKWFRHIQDDNTAAMSFIHEYADLMRDSYCGRVCKDWWRCHGCEENKLPDISDGEFSEILRKRFGEKSKILTESQVYVLHRHVARHKWIHKLPDYESAIVDFIGKFGWIIEDVCEIDAQS